MKTLISRALALTMLSAAQLVAANETWTWRAPLPQGCQLNAAAYSPKTDTVVVAGDFGTVMSKTGQGSWTYKRIPGVAGFSALTWTGSRFVAAPNDSSKGIFTSTDGTTWIECTDPSAPDARHLASDADRTVALGYYSADAWVSTDAARAKWVKKSLPLPAKGWYNDLSTNGSIFVAVGSGGLMATSADGLTWTKRTSGTTIELSSVASNGSGFVAVGYSWDSAAQKYQGAILKSANGIAWSTVALPQDESGNQANFSTVFSTGDGYIASGAGVFFTSPDGGEWTSVGFPDLGSKTYFSDFAHAAAPNAGNGGVILAGDGGLIASFDSTSNNFQTETPGFLGGFLMPDSFAATGLNGLFFAVDDNGSPRVIKSSDGITFEIDAADSTHTAFQRIGDSIVAAATDGSFKSTTDGTQWAPVGNATFQGSVASFAGAASGPAVAVTLDTQLDEVTYESTVTPRVYASSDWKTWAPIMIDGFSVYKGYGNLRPQVQWDGSRFLLLSPTGRLSTSSNGTVWTQLPALPSDTNDYLYASGLSGMPLDNVVASFASSGTVIVARGGKIFPSGSFNSWDSGRFFVFSEGAWTQQEPLKNLYTSDTNVAWNGSIFASANMDGSLHTSPDGVHWTRRELGAGVRQLVWTGNQFVALTDQFGILTHPTGLSTELSATIVPERTTKITGDESKQTVPVYGVYGKGAWTASSDSSWAQLSKTSGNGAGSIVVTFLTSPNPTGTTRTATVTINGMSFLFIQDGRPLGQLWAGTYAGIVGTLGTLEASSANRSITEGFSKAGGGVALTLTANSKSGDTTYTGSLRTGADTYTGKGVVTSNGTISAIWVTNTKPAKSLAVDLRIVDDFADAKYIRGTATGNAGAMSYDVLAGKNIRGGKNPPFSGAGTYTLLLAGAGVTNLEGTGYATVSLDASGVAKLAGKLADGTPWTTSATVWSATGLAGEDVGLFHVPLYGKQGAIAGWVRGDESQPDSDAKGAANWTAPGGKSGKRFADGISAHPSLVLSRYRKPSPNSRVLVWTNAAGKASLSDNWTSVIRNVTLSTKSTLSVADTPNTEKVAFALNPATGLVKGSFQWTDPDTRHASKVLIEGIVNQKAGTIKGFYLSPKGCGSVIVQSAN